MSTQAPTTAQKAATTGTSGILTQFAHLLGAQWFKDLLHTLLFIYLARISATTYGEFLVALELGMIVLFMGDFGLNQALVTDLGKQYSNRGDILARYSLLKTTLISAGLLATVGFVFWQGYNPTLKLVAILITAGMALEAVASSFFVACRVKGRQDLEARVRMVSCLLGYGFGIAVLFFGGPAPLAAAFKLIENVCNMVGGVYVSLTKSEWKNLKLQRKPFARTLRTARNGVVFLLIAFCGIIYNKANIFFMQQHGGPTAVAQYGVAWAIVEGVTILVSNILLRNVLYPLLVRLWNQDRAEYHRLAKTALRWLIGAALPAMYLLYAESDRIIGLVYGQETYQDAMWLQKLMVPALLFSFLHNFSAYLMMSLKKERPLMIFYFMGLAVNIALCWIFIPKYPMEGAVLAIVGTRAFMTCFTAGFCQRKLGFISLKALAPVGGAVLAAAALHYLAHPLGVRELTELATLAPFFLMGFMWWREGKKLKEKTLSSASDTSA